MAHAKRRVEEARCELLYQSARLEDEVTRRVYAAVTGSPATAAAAGIAMLLLPPVRAIVSRLLQDYLVAGPEARAFGLGRHAEPPEHPPLYERPVYAPHRRARAVNVPSPETPTYPPPHKGRPVFPPRESRTVRSA